MLIAQKSLGLAKLLQGAVDIALALHIAAAASWFWLSPKGFPLDCGQFWTNSVLPIMAILAAATGLWAMHRGNVRSAALFVLGFAAAWIGAAIAARLSFPISLDGKWLAILFVGLTGAALHQLLASGAHIRAPKRAAAAIAGAAVGVGAVWAQVPRSASTMPLNEPPPSQDFAAISASSIAIGQDRKFRPANGAITISSESVSLSCLPLLTFHRTSPDRFWSLLAPRSSMLSRRCTGQSATATTLSFRYNDGAMISMSTANGAAPFEATAYTPIATDAYSHLNSYCELAITGHEAPSLTFSPCGDVPVDILPADYPIGRPARMAYLDESGGFRVVEATSGEKGPFQSLAEGKLRRGEPLTITIRSNARPVMTVTLHDWSAQASTDLSPTAGWGFPANAIEFQRDSDEPDSPVGIWITLASTSVGRGYDTVGHRAGIYRNRITIRTLDGN